MVSCQTEALGHTLWVCPNFHNYYIQFHSCKSRFCSSCGVKYSKQRATMMCENAIDIHHRHIVFTIPEQLRNYFKENRDLLSLLFECSYESIKFLFNGRREAKRKNKNNSYTITPGYFEVIHTFGRDLKFNPHIHMLITEGGIDSRTNKLTNIKHFNYNCLKKLWQKLILDALHKELGKSFFPMKSKMFRLYKDGFYVYAPPQQFKDTKKGIEYIVRYAGRPAMAESRITYYNGEYVTYNYTPHEDENKTIEVTKHAYKFISKLITHIHKDNFKTIRYYGIYSSKNKSKNKYKKMYSYHEINTMKNLTIWRFSLLHDFKHDPIRCKCGQFMRMESSVYTPSEKGGPGYEVYYIEKNKYTCPKNWESFTRYCPNG